LKRYKWRSANGRPRSSVPSGKNPPPYLDLERHRIALLDGVQLIEAFDEWQIGQLLNDRERIRRAA
jgi:hypothetical protein